VPTSPRLSAAYSGVFSSSMFLVFSSLAVSRSCSIPFSLSLLLPLIMLVTVLVPSNDQDLLQSTGTAADSPFVLAFTRAGIKGLPSVINAGVLTSAFSASNSYIYGTSRMLYGLSLRGQVPRIFSKTNAFGLPWVSLVCTSSFGLLSYMALSEGASTVLNWLSNLTSIATFMTWAVICTAFLRWKSAMEAQGYDRSASKFL
jgi:yeast amino acid transporter